MPFRLAFGPCRCRAPYRDAIESAACEQLTALLRAWESRLPADLSSVPSEALEYIDVEGYGAALAVHKHARENHRTLIVCTVFVATWRRPTYFSFDGIGRLYAEGILVGADGTVTPAPDDLMWEFR